MGPCPSQPRREFLLKTMTMAASLPLVTAIQTFSKSARAQVPPKDADPNAPNAKALGYVKNLPKLKKKPDGYKEGALCWNCLLYNGNIEPKGVTKDQSLKASCAALGMTRVDYYDWCKSSWVQDATMQGKKHFKL